MKWACHHERHLINFRRERLSGIYQWYTAISRKVVAKTVHTTIPKGNMGYDQYTCSWHCSCRTYFCCFPLALANIHPWPLLPFFEIYLKNSELKTTHNTFRDCRVHFFRQPFSKQLYPICDFPRALKQIGGAASLITDIAPKSLFSCVNRNHT